MRRDAKSGERYASPAEANNTPESASTIDNRPQSGIGRESSSARGWLGEELARAIELARIERELEVLQRTLGIREDLPRLVLGLARDAAHLHQEGRPGRAHHDRHPL